MRALINSIRQLKLTFIVNNLLNLKALSANKSLYKQFGLSQPVWWPLSSKQTRKLPGGEVRPWLDVQNAREALPTKPEFAALRPDWQSALLSWSEQGFAVLPSVFSNDECKSILAEVERLKTEGKAETRKQGNRVVFAHKRSESTRNILNKSGLHELMSLMLGRKARLYHSINFDRGSQQPAHSDSIHMSTHPQGNLIAVWIALEDIQPGSGELLYYPGSHTLPYSTNDDYDHGGTALTIGANANVAYEQYAASLIEKNQFKSQTFLPKRGDVLVWHANLIHGGSAVTNPELTRRSMVLHYFGEGVICFHELTQRPVIFAPDHT
jgi:ectoine hydroxylase